MTDSVATHHPEYDCSQPLRKVFQDVCEGTHAMRKAGVAYLPKFPKEEQESWNTRKDTATLLNVTKKTVDSLCGLVFQGDITLDENAPQEIVDLSESIDNEGRHLNVFARDIFEDSFDGCSAILVDAPTTQATDLAEQKRLNLRPYWVEYEADAIINWDYQINPVSKQKELTLVVFKECVPVRTGMFTREKATRYRVFYLNNGQVYWQLWEEQKDATGKDTVVQIVPDTLIPSQTEIPVAIVGELGECPPLMDLAYKNIEHYQTYSDYKSILHKTCVPLFYTVNLDGQPEAIGADIWFKLNEGGSMGYAEPSGTSIDKVEKCLENLKTEMATLGLAMIMAKGIRGETTATEKMLDSIQETSALQVRATELKDAIEKALGFTCKYLGLEANVSIELGATWTELVLTAQDLQAMSGLVDLGQMSLESFVSILHKSGKLPPDVDVKDELERIKAEEKAAAAIDPVLNANMMPNGELNAKNPQAAVPVA